MREHEENLPEIISIAEIWKTVAFHRTEEAGEGAQSNVFVICGQPRY